MASVEIRVSKVARENLGLREALPAEEETHRLHKVFLAHLDHEARLALQEDL